MNRSARRQPWYWPGDQPFAPGEAPEHAIEPEEIAAAVALVLDYRAGVVVDELNLTPLKKVLRFRSPGETQ